eukprot:SAG22_NODE_4953_length_1123_cov_1.793945_2_plen_44_part_01
MKFGDKTRGEPYDVTRNHMVPPLVLSACYLMLSNASFEIYFICF